MATTDQCYQRIHNELVMPGRGFWTLSQFAGGSITGQMFFKGTDYAEVSLLASQGDGVTYYGSFAGRSLSRAMNDALALMEDVDAEYAQILESRVTEDAPADTELPPDTASGQETVSGADGEAVQ